MSEGLCAAKYYQKAPKSITWISILGSLIWMEITSGSILMIAQLKFKTPFKNVQLFLCSFKIKRTPEELPFECGERIPQFLQQFWWHSVTFIPHKLEADVTEVCGQSNYFNVHFFPYPRTQSSCCLLLFGLFFTAESQPKSCNLLIQIQAEDLDLWLKDVET